MLQGTTNTPRTDRHADDPSVPGEDDKFLHVNNRLHKTPLVVQRIVAFAILRYGENTFKQQTDGMIKIAVNTPLITVAKKAKNIFLSPIYGAVVDIVEQTVNPLPADNSISSRLHRLTES